MTPPGAIMLVEDDEGHAVLFMKHLRRWGVRNPIHHFVSGWSAWTFLTSPTTAVETLHLIVLDINLPDLPGTEVLARISAHPVVCAIPVVMLTSSDDPVDAQRVTELGSRHYMVKPLQVEHFVGVCSDLGYPLFIGPDVDLAAAKSGPQDSSPNDREP